MNHQLFLATLLLLLQFLIVHTFIPSANLRSRTTLHSSPDDPESLLAEARRLRESASQLSSELPARPPPPSFAPPPTIQVYGSNGLLGSHLTKTLLRSTKSPVTALVHDYSRVSKLSLTVGAEDGKGQIQAAWKSLEQSMEYDPTTQSSFGLDRLSLLECEILDPATLPPPADIIYFCATDFAGNKPRAISRLDPGLLFRSISRPLKGRVEIEGLKNLLQSIQKSKKKKDKKVTLIVPTVKRSAYGDFVTPFGDFHSIKKEQMDLLKAFKTDVDTRIVVLPRIDTLRESSGGIEVIEGLGGEGGEERKEWIGPEDAARIVTEIERDSTIIIK